METKRTEQNNQETPHELFTPEEEERLIQALLKQMEEDCKLSDDELAMKYNVNPSEWD